MDTIQEIQERHGAVKEIERNLNELHQVFLDMSVLVQTQGEQLDDIESHMARANSYVRGGVQQLHVARKHQKNSRKWTCIAIILLLIIVLVIVLPIVLKNWWVRQMGWCGFTGGYQGRNRIRIKHQNLVVKSTQAAFDSFLWLLYSFRSRVLIYPCHCLISIGLNIFHPKKNLFDNFRCLVSRISWRGLGHVLLAWPPELTHLNLLLVLLEEAGREENGDKCILRRGGGVHGNMKV